jgi:hypothetical protein
MKNIVKIGSIAFIAIIGLIACEKGGNDKIDNPYDNVKTIPLPKDSNTSYSNSSIQGLHKNLFLPSCANSGCHDGTFEPDFRTVQSSYNSLVNIKPIKNDLAGTFSARVVPGNADMSILPYRMTVDLGGNSGIMPLVLDPGSDYPSKKDALLVDLKKWINDGAKDFNGNPPAVVDFPPQILGVTGLIGTSIIARGGKYEPMVVASGTNMQLWFSLSDDKVAQNNLTNVKINWSTDPEKYNTANEQPLVQASSKVMAGLYGASTTYSWYFNFSTAGLKPYEVIWFKITCSDGTNINYQLPNDNSMFFLKKYFAVRII